MERTVQSYGSLSRRQGLLCLDNGRKTHFEKLKPYKNRPHEMRAEENGDRVVIWDDIDVEDDADNWTVIAPTARSQSFQEEWGSHASSFETLEEPSFRREYNLRPRRRPETTVNENYISAGEQSPTRQEGETADIMSDRNH
jgi:hypothetical protein